MPRVSRYRLSQRQIDYLGQHIIDAVFLLRQRDMVGSFFNDLLSTTEKVMLGKRFLIAMMIEQGDSYLDIRRILKVSDPTIASVSERLKTGGSGFRAAIKQLARQKRIDSTLRQFVDPIKELHRRLPKIAYKPQKSSL